MLECVLHVGYASKVARQIVLDWSRFCCYLDFLLFNFLLFQLSIATGTMTHFTAVEIVPMSRPGMKIEFTIIHAVTRIAKVQSTCAPIRQVVFSNSMLECVLHVGYASKVARQIVLDWSRFCCYLDFLLFNFLLFQLSIATSTMTHFTAVEIVPMSRPGMKIEFTIIHAVTRIAKVQSTCAPIRQVVFSNSMLECVLHVGYASKVARQIVLDWSRFCCYLDFLLFNFLLFQLSIATSTMTHF